MITIATVYCWIIVAIRLRLTIRRPQFGRIALTASFVAVALAFTVRIPAFDEGLQRLTGSFNGTHLVFRLAIYVAACAISIFLVNFRSGGRIGWRSSAVNRRLVLGSLVSVVTVVLFLTPAVKHAPNTDFIGEQSIAGLPPKLYILIGSLYIVGTMLEVSITLWRVAVPFTGARTQSISLLLVATGTLIGSVAGLATDVRVLIDRLPSQAALTLYYVNLVGGYLTLAFVSVGLVLPVTLRFVGRVIRDARTVLGLNPLWTAAAASFPDLIIARPGWLNPIERLQFAALRRKIEVDDALAMTTVPAAAAESIRRDPEPLVALGSYLAEHQPWTSQPQEPAVVDLLPKVSGSDREAEQLISLAHAARSES